MCGEKRNQKRKSLSLSGSPPRVRGKDGDCSGLTKEGGITPACAGKRGAVEAP